MKHMEEIQKRFAYAHLNNYLDLSNLELFDLPKIPDELYNIKYLFINDNKLTNIDLKPFADLQVIDVSNNPIRTIDIIPDNLEELVCNCCELEHIIFHKNLKKLHCSSNLLENIEEYYPNAMFLLLISTLLIQGSGFDIKTIVASQILPAVKMRGRGETPGPSFFCPTPLPVSDPRPA